MSAPPPSLSPSPPPAASSSQHRARILRRSTTLVRPANVLAVCGGYAFTEVYAPISGDDQHDADSGAPSAGFMAIADQAQKDTPYGVAIWPIRSSSEDEDDDADEDGREQQWIIGGHESQVTAIATLELQRLVTIETGTEEESNLVEQVETDVLLCTSSPDAMILWQLSDILACLSASPPRQPTGRHLPHAFPSTAMEFDAAGTKISVCQSGAQAADVTVIDLESGTIDAVLQGHNGKVNAASFVPAAYLTDSASWPKSAAASSVSPALLSSSHILTLGSDRTFKLWDLLTRRLVYTSSIVSASPFTRVAWDADQAHAAAARFILATEDAKVRQYEFRSVLPGRIASVLAAAAAATSPSGATSAPAALPAASSSIRLVHTLDLALLSRRLIRGYELASAAAKRRREAAAAKGKVIHATAAPGMTTNQALYRPHMSSEENVPGGGSEEELYLPHEKDENQPPLILAMMFPAAANPTAASSSSSTSSAAPAPRTSPSSSPTSSPSSSPSASLSALSLTHPPHVLYLALSRCVVRVNLSTYEVEWMGAFVGAGEGDDAEANYTNSLPGSSPVGSPSSASSAAPSLLHPLPVGFAGCACFVEPQGGEEDGGGGGEEELLLLTTSPFVGETTLLSITLPIPDASSSGASSSISVYPSGPLPRSSSLRNWAWVTPSSSSTGVRKKTAGPPPKRGARPGQIGAQKDHDLVFHKKIKGSGYGPAPTAGSASGKTGAGRPRQLNLGGLHQKVNTTMGRAFAAGQRKPSASPPPAAAEKHYPMHCGLIHTLHAQNPPSKSPPLHNGPIVSLAWSTDAKRLLTASLDSTACVVRWPSWKHPQGSSHLIGHKKSLRSASWWWRSPKLPAGKEDLVMTSSADGTARMWQVGRADPLLVFDRMKKSEPASERDAAQASSSSTAAASKSAGSSENPLFTAELPYVSFFRQNQLVVLAHRNQLLLYKYYLDPAKTNTDLKKLQNWNQYKLLTAYTEPTSHSVTTFSCFNHILSSLVLFADSGRNLHWYDAGVGKVVRTVADAHSKSIHCITMNPSTVFNSGGRGLAATTDAGEESIDQQQLVLTVATDSAIKLWDVRSKDCVRRFSGHVNRSASVRATFSPCGRYIACGSEDNRAYVFDVRNGNVIDKLSGATDVVSDVSYHPLHAQILTSCYDGRIRCYAEA